MTRSKPAAPWEGPWQNPAASLDLYDVTQWFSQNPAACVDDPRVQTILRSFEHPYRPWVKFPDEAVLRRSIDPEARRLGKSQARIDKAVTQTMRVAAEPLVRRQGFTWWRELRKQIFRLEVPSDLSYKFADYLTGYVLIREQEQPRSGRFAFYLAGKKRLYDATKNWRKLKRSLTLRAIGITPQADLTTQPAHREHLRTRLLVLMAADLAALGHKPSLIPERFLSAVFQLIGENMVPASILREIRRSRRRAAR